MQAPRSTGRPRTEPWPNDGERRRIAVERLIGPLKVVWVVSMMGLILAGPLWLFVPVLLAYPIIEICKRFAAGSDGLEGWAVEKASRGGTSETWQLRLPNEVGTRRNLPRYIEAASRRGYIATGPSSMSVRTIATTFARAENASPSGSSHSG